jgi:hypothetical protein
MKSLHVCDVSIIAVSVETPKKAENNHCEVNKGKEKVQHNIYIVTLIECLTVFNPELTTS